MARYEITGPNGERYEVTAPDDATNEQIMAFVQSEGPRAQAPKPAPSVSDRAASIGTSVVSGLKSPVLGLSQAIARGGRYASTLGGIFEPNAATKFFDEEANLYDNQIKQDAENRQSMRDRAGFDGVDLSYLAGNVLSPANVLVAGKAANAIKGGATLGNMIWQGSSLGAKSAIMQPVENTDNYAGEKASQIGLSALAGGVATPAIAKISTAVSRQIKALGNRLNQANPDDVILGAFKEAGLEAQDFSKTQMDAIRAEVSKSLKSGKIIDPAALARKADFDALNVPYLSGQVTRDPMQFTKERNLRGLEGIGEPLTARMNEQDRALSGLLSGKAVGARSRVDAGDAFVGDLKGLDDQMSRRVSGLYKDARASAGSATDVPMTGLAQDMGDIARRYEGNIPKGLLNQFDDYGLLGMNQTRMFDMTDAERLLQQTNKYGSATDDAIKNSIDETRAALKRAITEGADDGGPFALPRKAAAERFKLHEATKALDDVVTGRAVPDKFVDKYILKAPTKEVENLGKILSNESREEAKKQIAAHLDNIAYGGHNARDNAFNHKGFNKALTEIGDRRLKAFFSGDEIAEIKRIGRVAEYITSQPKNATVNNSNTTSALYNLARSTGSGLFNQPLMDFLPKVADRYGKSQAVNYALTTGLRGELPALSNNARRNIGLLSGFGGLTGGLLASE